MDDRHQNDTVVSHRILNFLFAGYQGEYTFHRALQELGGEVASPEKLRPLDASLQKISKWYGGLSIGDCLISSTWKMPETFEAQRAIKLLEALREITSKAANELREIQRSEWKTSADSVRRVIAHIARNAQAARVYAQGVVDLARILNDSEALAGADVALTVAKNEAEVAAQFVSSFKSDALTEFSFELLQKRIRSASATLGAQSHDILLILSQYKGGENYVAKSFETSELNGWLNMNVTVFDAGFWRAYGFEPIDAGFWIENGVSLPAVAAMWQLEDFEPAEAAQWMNYGLTPEAGRKWKDAGYELQAAIAYIKRGVLLPDQMPSGD